MKILFNVDDSTTSGVMRAFCRTVCNIDAADVYNFVDEALALLVGMINLMHISFSVEVNVCTVECTIVLSFVELRGVDVMARVLFAVDVVTIHLRYIDR